MKSSFSKKDFIVLTGCILFAIANICSVGKMGRENARRVVCVSNIKTQLAGFINLANENNGKIFGDYGWLDGTDRYKYKDLMEAMGLSTEGSIVDNWNFAPLAQQDIHAPDIFYCPSNISKKERNRQFWWDFDIGNGARAPFRLIGYAWILENDYGMTPKSKILGSGNKKWIVNLNTVVADSAELVTDLAYSDRVSGKFDSIISGGSGGTGAGIPESSSHIRNSYSVYGSNIGFCDGHVEWRPFNQMEKRWAWGSGPYFWW